jgi:TolA-binding protein
MRHIKGSSRLFAVHGLDGQCSIASFPREVSLVTRAIVVVLFLYIGLAGSTTVQARTKAEPDAEQFYSGNALYNRKLYLLAVAEYKEFLRKHPRHGKAEQARWGIAICYYAAGKHQEAESSLREVIERGKWGDRNQLLLYRGHCLSRLNKLDDAEKVFAEVRGEEYQPVALTALTDARFRQSKWDEAMDSARRLMVMKPAEALARRALYQAGYAAREVKKWNAGIGFLEPLRPLLKEHALRPQAAYLLGECYREADELQKATAEYEVAVAGMQDKEIAAEIYYRLGFIQFLQKNYDETIAAMEQCRKLDREGPFYDQANFYSGRSYLEKEDHNRATQYLQPLSRLKAQRKPKKNSKFTPKTPISEAGLWLARVYSRRDNYGQAAKVLNEAVSRFRNDPLVADMYFDLGNALVMEKQYKEASQALANVIKRQDFPQRNDALRLQAACYHRLKDYNTSLRYADEFLAKHRDDPLVAEALFMRAENLYLLKRDDEAVKAYSDYLTTQKGHVSEDAARFRIAQLQYRKGDWQKTLAAAAPLVEKQPEGRVFSQLNFVTGDCHFRLKAWEAAAGRLEVFIGQHLSKQKNRKPEEPNVDGALMQLAVCRMNGGDDKKAVEHLNTLVRLYADSPHLPLALAELGRLEYESGDRNKARSHLGRFLERHEKAPQRPQAEYYMGWISLDEGKKPEAEEHFSTVVKRYPRDPRAPNAALQLGIVQMEQEKHREAQQTLSNLIRGTPDLPALDRAHFELGLAYARGGDPNRASEHFRTVVETYAKAPFADRAVYEWAWAEKARKKNDEAAKRYQFLLEKYPQSALVDKVRTELAELTFGKKDYVNVIAQLKDTLANLKDESVRENTTYRLGTAYFNNGDYDESAAVFEAFVEEFKKSPKLASAYFQAGESRMKTRETIKAREHYKAATKTKIQPEIQESALMRLGETQGLTEQWKESSETYSRFLQTYPESQWAMRARFGMAWALQKQKDYKRAGVEYGKIVAAKKKDEWSAQAQFQLGECYFEMKQYDKAVQEFVRVGVNYKFKKWTASSILEMGRALEAKGEKDRAREQYRELIRKYPDQAAAQVGKERLDALRRE